MYYKQDKLAGITPKEILDYLRKSQSDNPLLTVEEVLAKHESMLDEWAEKNLGEKVPEENKYREVVSGETLKSRPEIQTVLKRIESPKIKAVKVVDPQRLTRGDLEDIGRLMKLFKHTNTLVITTDGRMEKIYDLRDEYDWDAFERELKRGNEFLEYTKKILNRGKLLSVSQGNFIGSKAPYGFDRTKVMVGNKECPTLKENKEKADAVRLIFDLYVNSNMGRIKIARYLDSLHIPPAEGERWSAGTLKDMLMNVHYIGKVRWNWRKTVTIVEDGQFVKTRPHQKIGEYLVFEGRHDGIVSEELFNAAQERLGKNPRTKPEVKTHNPLAGLLYCSCGRAMIMNAKRDNNDNFIEPPRLVCPAQSHCKTRSSKVEEVLEAVCKILESCIEDFEVRIENNEGDSAKLHASLVQNLEKQLKDLEAREIKQWELQSDPDETKRMPQHIFQQLNEKLLKDKEEIKLALCEAYESMPEPVDYTEKVITFKEALEALRDPQVDTLKKNVLLKTCIERITYSRERGQRLAVKVTKFETGWTDTPIQLDVKLRV